MQRRRKQSVVPTIVAIAITAVILCCLIALMFIFANQENEEAIPPSSGITIDKTHVPGGIITVPGGTILIAENVDPEKFCLTKEQIDELYAIIAAAEAEEYLVPAARKRDIESRDIDDGIIGDDSDRNPESGSNPESSPESGGATAPETEIRHRNISLFFEDLSSGYTLGYNSELKYFTASLIKAPFCTYLYTLADKGELDLEEAITIEYSQLREGTGKISKMPFEDFPISLSVSELIEQAIRNSDNTAMDALKRRFGVAGFTEYATKLGLNYPEDIKEITNGSITAIDANIYIKAIYNYIQNGKHGYELKDHMSRTVNPLIVSSYPVIRKYGWTPNALHDMAIIDAPHPYLVTICTDGGMGNSSDYRLYRRLSEKLQEFHDNYYTADLPK